MRERDTAETADTLKALVQHLIRLSDECSYVVRNKANALFGLAELAFIEG